MKIFYVCHRFPYPPKRGGKIRPFNMIRHFHEQGHQVTVASLVRSSEEEQEARGLDAHCASYLMARVSRLGAVARMLSRLPTPIPSSMGYFYSRRLARDIRTTLRRQRFDLIFVHCSSVAQYVQEVRGTPKILDFGDMDSQKWLIYGRVRGLPVALGFHLEGAKLLRAEKALARRFDLCTCTTRAELETLESYGTGARTGWFPNGVDRDYFAPDGNGYDPDRICFVGRMDYFPNQQAMLGFCHETLPLLLEQRPRLQLEIVGASPSRAIRRLGEHPAVRVTGTVPDVRPHVRRAALSVAPLAVARGTQNKMLESMAMGVPVVASAAAAGGVDAIPGEHLLVARDARGYRDAILALLEDRRRRDAMSRAGVERMRDCHDWARSMSRLDALVASCLDGPA